MDKPLSYSGYKRFTTCPKYYEFYDIKKEKPPGMSTALIVGTIVGDVCEAKLKGIDIDFREKVLEAIEQYERIDFFDHDLDLDFVDLESVEKFAKEAGWQGDDISAALKDFIKEQKVLSDGQYSVLSFATWQSLDTKMECMIESFNKWILPQIKEVHEIQYHLDDGKTHGYLDFVATMNDGRKVLFDIKTAKAPYDQNAVLRSPQLSLYAAMYDIEYAGFIVLVKSLNKNKEKFCKTCDFTVSGGAKRNCSTCKTPLEYTMKPSSYSQMIINKVPDHNKALTKEAMYDTIKAIDNGVFPRNLNTCFWLYGKFCPYVETCWNKRN